jgi:hypothetical protein
MRPAMRLAFIVLVVIALAACRPPGWGRGDGTDIDAAMAGPDGPGPDGAIDAAATCTKAFRLDGHSIASSVSLTGSFTGWAASPPAAIAFTLGNDGAWTGSHTFAVGLHQYKFVVSGNQWIADPTNPDRADDGLGGQNSVYTCVP